MVPLNIRLSMIMCRGTRRLCVTGLFMAIKKADNNAYMVVEATWIFVSLSIQDKAAK